jgi:hypothetical protein
MNFQFYLEKLYSSSEFQKFKKDNPDCFPCSAFFSFDFTKSKNLENKQHFDFCVSDSDKIFSFMLEKDCELVPIDNLGKQELKKITLNYDFDFNTIKNKIEEEMSVKEINKTIEKILLSLQNFENKDYIVGTVFISGLGMIKIRMTIPDLEFEEFERKSFMDMINVFKKK